MSIGVLCRYYCFTLTSNNMTNLKKNDELQAIMNGLSNYAPLISFAIACLAFTLVGVFKADYYSGVLSERWLSWAKFTGIAIAVVTEGARAVLLLLTFADFRKRNFRGGWLGLVLSIGLVFYDCSGAGAVSAIWTGEHAGQLGAIVRDLIVFLVVLSFGIEFRLVLSRPGSSLDADTKEDSFLENGQRVKQNGQHVA